MSSKYEIARELAREALQALHEQGEEKASGQQLFDWARQNQPERLSQVEKSWWQFLTRMLVDPDAWIVREPNRYGFKLRPVAEVQPVEEPEEDRRDLTPITYAEPKKIQRERKLYAVLVEWLAAKLYRVCDTSQTKAGGAWGNPDVVGLRTYEGFGATFHIELVSIEAKLTEGDWRKVFFEAVAHKRFADRAYFAFAYSASDATIDNVLEFHALREYGEKYRVGVLVLFMDPEIHKKLCEDKDISSLVLTPDNVRVEELWPAVSDPVAASSRERFIQDVLGVRKAADLYTFGTALPS